MNRRNFSLSLLAIPFMPSLLEEKATKITQLDNGEGWIKQLDELEAERLDYYLSEYLSNTLARHISLNYKRKAYRSDMKSLAITSKEELNNECDIENGKVVFRDEKVPHMVFTVCFVPSDDFAITEGKYSCGLPREQVIHYSPKVFSISFRKSKYKGNQSRVTLKAYDKILEYLKQSNCDDNDLEDRYNYAIQKIESQLAKNEQNL